MIRHLRLDCGTEKPFQCSVCKKTFKRKYHLKRHYTIHCINYDDLLEEEHLKQKIKEGSSEDDDVIIVQNKIPSYSLLETESGRSIIKQETGNDDIEIEPQGDALVALRQLADITAPDAFAKLLPTLPKVLISRGNERRRSSYANSASSIGIVPGGNNKPITLGANIVAAARDRERSVSTKHYELKKLQLRYPCVTCGKSYLRKAHLKRHMRNECIDVPPKFCCEICPSKYRRNEDLKRHMSKVHHIFLRKRDDVDNEIFPSLYYIPYS
ncbi:zinc finger protein with KRAB and SCAN domains 5-like [Eupeodes corollae]|uniref:zinc finger protein with KRAB and SCAN domains 5-like n=1 Tax=Eupeodes corollae TaxID=290404 RepID=UPI00249066E0|nr:zinc finger protein with KRAB and SCAN domains 5-like [Eupeodes corollae]